MKPFSSPQSKAALQEIKAFIVAHLPPAKLDALASEAMSGTNDEEVERAVRVMVLQLCELLKDAPMSDSLKVVLPVAAGYVIRDRLEKARSFANHKLNEIAGKA